MKEYHDNISDKEIRELLKQRLLAKEDDVLLNAEEKLAYSLVPIVFPSANMEKTVVKNSLIKKGLAKFIKKYVWKFLVTGVSVITATVSMVYLYEHRSGTKQEKRSSNGNIRKHEIQNSISMPLKTDLKEELNPANFKNTTMKGNGSTLDRSEQLVDAILMENADCTHPIFIHDSILVSKYAPQGSGKEMEISGNPMDDSMYVEKEHNIVWYRFVAREDSRLSLDIIPMDKDDDYDFMLFQYNGIDFRSNLISKKIKPVRACISRNDDKLKGATGLTTDKTAPEFIRSGAGKSYVRSISVLKGQIFYLLVDAVKIKKMNGAEGTAKSAGHTIKLHYQKYLPDELYVGKRLYFNRIEFVAGSARFKSWSGYTSALDTIALFLQNNPKIKIEIQGHVNSVEPQLKNGNKTPTQELSEYRAKAVFDCLVERGIDSSRMAQVGYGSSQKIILLPKRPSECRKNVRVEVVIRAVE